MAKPSNLTAEQQSELDTKLKTLTPKQVSGLRTISRTFKTSLSQEKVRTTTAKQLSDGELDLLKISTKNRERLLASLQEQNSLPDAERFFGQALPTSLNQDIAYHANHIFEEHYLQPYSSTKLGEYELRTQPEVQRKTHGAMHASRVGLYARLFANLYREFGDVEAQKLTEEDVLLLQIVAMFHDSARQNDGNDIWDNNSAELCFNYLKSIGVNEERAKFFSHGISYKDVAGEKNIVQKVIHDADCLDVIRMAYQFKIEELDFYQKIVKQNPQSLNQEAFERIKKIVFEARELVSKQNDFKHKDHKEAGRIAVGYDQSTIVEGGKEISVTFDLAKKKEFEHAPNCFAETQKFITSNKTTLPAINSSLNQALPKAKTLQTSEATSVAKSTAATKSPLAAQEQVLLENLINANWTLHHTTKKDGFDAILASESKALQDPQERGRWGGSAIANHTPELGGIEHNVFFGIGIGAKHIRIPSFLHQNDSVTVLANVEEVMRGLLQIPKQFLHKFL